MELLQRGGNVEFITDGICIQVWDCDGVILNFAGWDFLYTASYVDP